MEVGFAKMDLSQNDAINLFDKTFGFDMMGTDEYGLTASKEYYNPSSKVDLREDIKEKMFGEIQKQSIDTQTGGAGTAGTALIPVYVDSSIVDRTDRMTPMTDMLPRRAIRGLTYDYIPLTAKAGAAFALEDGALGDQVDTYDRTSVAMKYLYAVGRITGQAVAGMRGFIDPNALDLRVKVKSMKEAEENAIINGDATTNIEEFDGLIQTITTNTTNLSSTNVTLAQIRAEYATTFNANGMVTLAVTDASTHNYIKNLLQDLQRQPAPAAEGLPFGIPGAFSYDGVNFIKDRYMPTTSGSRRILFLDMRYIFLAVLQDVTYEELAKTNDSNKYMLKEYFALAMTFEASSSQIYGIA